MATSCQMSNSLLLHNICHDKSNLTDFKEFRKSERKKERKMSSDWDEIRRLASDFQKVQLSSTLQR